MVNFCRQPFFQILMTGIAGDIFVIGWVFFVLMAGFAGLFTCTFMNLAVHLFNGTPATMATFTGIHLMIIIEFRPILSIRMTQDAVTWKMGIYSCFYFIISQTNKVESPHSDCLFLLWIIIKMAGNTIINATMVILNRLPGDGIMTIGTFPYKMEGIYPVATLDLEIIAFR